MQRCDGALQPLEQPTSVAGDPSRHDPTVRTLTRSAREPALFEAVEEPGNVGITHRRSLSDRGQRCAGAPGVLKDTQDVILLRCDAGWPQ